MSEILQKIKQDQLVARKNRDQRIVTILSTVIGEMETIATRDRSEITDEQVTRNIDKAIDAIKQRIEARGETADLLFEMELLQSYVPRKLTEDEIRTIKQEIGATSAKELMPYLKQHYAGMYDGKVASMVANEK